MSIELSTIVANAQTKLVKQKLQKSQFDTKAEQTTAKTRQATIKSMALPKKMESKLFKIKPLNSATKSKLKQRTERIPVELSVTSSPQHTQRCNALEETCSKRARKR